MLKIIGNNKLDQLDDILVMYSKRPPQTDIEKNEMFEYCLEYVKWYMIKNERKLSAQDYDFVKFHVAEELYFRLLRNDLRNVNHITLYMDSGQYLCTLKEALHLIGSRYNKKSSNPQYLRHNPCAPKRYSMIPAEDMIEKEYLVNCIQELTNAVYKFIRYYKWSSTISSMNARISISLSMKYNEFTSFHLNKEDESTCRFLYNKYRCTLRKILTAMNSLYDRNSLTESESLFWEVKLQNEEILERSD